MNIYNIFFPGDYIRGIFLITEQIGGVPSGPGPGPSPGEVRGISVRSGNFHRDYGG